MPSKRLARLSEQLRREIAELLRSSVRDPRVGGVTVTAVRVSADLSTARVHVRLPPGPAERADTLEGLHAAAPFLRRTLGRSLHVRRIPELRFLEDTSLEHAQRIEALLAEVLPADESTSDARGDMREGVSTEVVEASGEDEEPDGA
ncbi:MAG: 30S ribosome-binding factor RbfA [Gemmatimonadetes bacterium]|nr:30S ribosome-binding factor RbfA [Gemmatimonadota bacterium]